MGLRTLARTLLDRTYFVPDEAVAYSPEAREALADVLDSFASPWTTPSRWSPEARPAGWPTTLRTGPGAETGWAHISDPLADPGAWAQHGALLSAVDRLRVEVDVAIHPSDAPWRPQPWPTGRARRCAEHSARRGGPVPCHGGASGRRALAVAAHLRRRRSG